jgi:hypothetical protein
LDRESRVQRRLGWGWSGGADGVIVDLSSGLAQGLVPENLVAVGVASAGYSRTVACKSWSRRRAGGWVPRVGCAVLRNLHPTQATLPVVVRGLIAGSCGRKVCVLAVAVLGIVEASIACVLTLWCSQSRLNLLQVRARDRKVDWVTFAEASTIGVDVQAHNLLDQCTGHV